MHYRKMIVHITLEELTCDGVRFLSLRRPMALSFFPFRANVENIIVKRVSTFSCYFDGKVKTLPWEDHIMPALLNLTNEVGGAYRRVSATLVSPSLTNPQKRRIYPKMSWVFSLIITIFFVSSNIWVTESCSLQPQSPF